MKKCCVCKFEKDLNEFHKASVASDGHKNICKECQKKRDKEHYEERKEDIRDKSKKRYAINLEIDPSFNAKLYQKNKPTFKRRLDQFLRTVRGRMSSLHSSAVLRSKRKKLLYELSLNWLCELYEKQNGKCALTGIDFILERNPEGQRGALPYSPSLDRINASLGYTKDNVRLVCAVVNLALNKFGDQVFDKICRAYVTKCP